MVSQKQTISYHRNQMKAEYLSSVSIDIVLRENLTQIEDKNTSIIW